MANLYPVFEAPALVPSGATATPAQGKAWAWDFVAGDFVLDGTGRLVELDGANAWAQWCIKAVLTERYVHLIYSGQYGCEVEAAMRSASNRRSAESEVSRAITEALVADPRTRSVRDFAFVWAGDEISVAFTVEPVTGAAAKLEVTLNGG